jgi:hypothetical protein
MAVRTNPPQFSVRDNQSVTLAGLPSVLWYNEGNHDSWRDEKPSEGSSRVPSQTQLVLWP